MFTGIVTDQGEIRRMSPRDHGVDLEIATSYDVGSIDIGASVCHNGICLTVVERMEGRFLVHASEETLRVTTMKDWQVGDRLNLERSLVLGSELGGHIVFGHVDGVGDIKSIDAVGASYRLVIRMPEELAPLIAQKGSIAVDGISLTVNEADVDSFTLMIIPHTWSVTNLAGRKVGDTVNLEVDMLARYVARQLAYRQS